MALDYGTEYPGQIDTAAAYPQGKARNVSAPGAGDGTPWIANLVNDLLFGPWQAILKLTGTVPSGTPDSASTSQYMEALAQWLWGNLVAANWTPSLQGSDHFNAVCYSPDLGYWIAVGENGRVMSANGWSVTLSTIGGAPNLNAVCWSESEQLFIACGDGGVMYTSPDGGTWTARASNTTNDLMALAVRPGSPDTIVAVGINGGDAEAVYSNDGITWTPATHSPGYNWHSVCWASDLSLFVAADNSGNSFTSPDGVTWTVVPTGYPGNGVHDIAWSVHHQKLIGVGAAGRIMTSPDAVTWTEVAAITGLPTFHGVTVDETLGQVLAVGEDGVYSSFNLTTWYKRLTHDINLRAASFSQALGQTLVVGDSGLTMYSLRCLRP